jgi:hypothetical protein
MQAVPTPLVQGKLVLLKLLCSGLAFILDSGFPNIAMQASQRCEAALRCWENQVMCHRSVLRVYEKYHFFTTRSSEFHE